MNNESNKTTRKTEESGKTVAGSMTAAKPSAWKKLLSKRWVFPAAYMAAAAIIVTILWLNAGNQGKDPETSVPGASDVAKGEEGQSSPDSQPVTANGETLRWPVEKFESFTTAMSFYEQNGSEAEREAAMIKYQDQYFPHTAVDLARKDAKEFDVVAAMSGKVTVAEQTPLNGYEVNIDHGNGLVTVYQSLQELKVKVGDEVKQGEKIAKAGVSTIEAGEGVHVHFEVLQDDASVNPVSLMKSE